MKTPSIAPRSAVFAIVIAGLAALLIAAAESKSIMPDLAAAPAEHGWKLINRAATVIDKDGAKAICLEGESGTGFARLEDVSFGDGTIEFDARGRDVLQRSFLGVAFHGADAKTYDAVYFRPFNFKPADVARRLRAVQYISHPTYPGRSCAPIRRENTRAPSHPCPIPTGGFTRVSSSRGRRCRFSLMMRKNPASSSLSSVIANAAGSRSGPM